MPFIYTSIWAQRYFPFYFGAIFFYSNLELLQTEGDYFSDTTEKMPFLHTWSLGVEMQFYLVAPIFFYVSKIDSITISSSGFILTGAKSTTHWSHFRLGYIAKISYALYLVHFPVLRFIEYLVEYHEKEINGDKVMETYWEGIEKISEHTKKLFIQTHQPFGCLAKNNDFLNRFLDGLQKTKDLETFNQPFNKTDYYNSVVHQRLKVIMERCKKCHLIDITDAFVDSKRNLVLTYDPKTSLSYFDNQCHMTASGLKKIEKVFLLEIQAGLKEN
ncbi:unnamed protein product, partial [Mesorhabditis belari]|uniref:SGNH domain-containing protein n=1 Tax=Mesorhabditis belari TaxID=2138241 RepID=A0AAF3ENQ0_9BILA